MIGLSIRRLITCRQRGEPVALLMQGTLDATDACRRLRFQHRRALQGRCAFPGKVHLQERGVRHWGFVKAAVAIRYFKYRVASSPASPAQQLINDRVPLAQ